MTNLCPDCRSRYPEAVPVKNPYFYRGGKYAPLYAVTEGHEDGVSLALVIPQSEIGTLAAKLSFILNRDPDRIEDDILAGEFTLMLYNGVTITMLVPTRSRAIRLSRLGITHF